MVIIFIKGHILSPSRTTQSAVGVSSGWVSISLELVMLDLFFVPELSKISSSKVLWYGHGLSPLALGPHLLQHLKLYTL